MVHFEEGKVYNYNEIETILNNTSDYVMEDLKKERDEQIKDKMGNMMFEIHTTMILMLYKSALLTGVEEDNE